MFNLFLMTCITIMDQWTKSLVLAYQHKLPIKISDMFSIVLVYNPGVSFGLLKANTTTGPYFLLAFALGLVGLLVYWYVTSKDSRQRIFISMILGGAIGNMIDRWYLGKVVDFLDVHLGSLHWPTFNVADSFIVIGVIALALSQCRKPTI